MHNSYRRVPDEVNDFELCLSLQPYSNASYLESLLDEHLKHYIFMFIILIPASLSRIRIHLNECPILNNIIIEPKNPFLQHICYISHMNIVFFFIHSVILENEMYCAMLLMEGKDYKVHHIIIYVFVYTLWTIQFWHRYDYTLALFTQNC